MTDFFNAFPKSSKAEWEAQLLLELKGKGLNALQESDEIEDLNYSSYYHREDALRPETPGQFPYKRGMNKEDNQWKNGAFIHIGDVKTANKKALFALNAGANLLVFKALGPVDWPTVLNEIQLEFIETQFVLDNVEEFKRLHSFIGDQVEYVQFNMDFLHEKMNCDDLKEVATYFKTQQSPFCAVHGFKLQQCGANAWQEVAFCLSSGHEYLVKLMELGFTIDEAAACICFKVGVGSKYVLETAKFRALHQGWSNIIRAYSPQHTCSYNCSITAIVGHTNKSLIDPFTNLLRQTTEAMSAVSGGIDSLVILPYDLLSSEGASELSERMALNITSILKEESFFDKVIDPLGGSYSLEQVSLLIGEKAWEFFKAMEGERKETETLQVDSLISEIERTREIRLRRIHTSEDTFIGVNKYPDPKPKSATWVDAPTFLGLSYQFLEPSSKLAKA